MQTMIVIAFVLIVASLTAALFFMLRGDRQSDGSSNTGKRMAWALTVRIAVSVLVFLCILLAWRLGYIQPHGIPLGK